MSTTQSERPATLEGFQSYFGDIAANIEQVIRGKRGVIEMMLLCLIAEGHLLIEDVPGVGKTSLAKALARSIDTSFGRVQFTPDLLPTDVLGVTIWDRDSRQFDFRAGPIFANIVLADEINRASPKTQSALLESMAEGQATVDGTTYGLASPFMVIATQNPIEHEGTYPLPDSQLDRFLMRLSVGYPAREAEIDVLEGHGDQSPLDQVSPVVSADQVEAMIGAAREVHVSQNMKSYLVDLADATRRHQLVNLGMSPRATLALQRVGRARAAAAGRNYLSPDDIKALAGPVLSHRLVLSPDAQLRGASADEVLAGILDQVPVPSEV